MRHPRRYKNGVPIDDEPTADAAVVDEFSAIAADATQRLTELQEARQRLAPEALTSDSNAESELQGVLAEIRAAEEALENVRLARTERARRAREAHEQAGAEARERAMAEAQRLQGEREAAAQAFDSHARKAGHALADYSRICADQQRALSAAGRRGGPAPSSSIERALARAFSDAGVPRGMCDLPPLSGRPAPLSELDPRHVEPAGESDTAQTRETKGD